MNSYRLTHLKGTRIRVHIRPAGSGRAVRAARPAVFRRQRLHRPEPSGAQSLLARQDPVSRCCISIPATISPRRSAYRDQWVEQIGAKLLVRYVQDSIDAGRVVEEKGVECQPQRAPDRHAARRARRVEDRRGHRRRAARRREGARQRALLLAPRRVRAVGPEEPASRNCGTSSTAKSTSASISASFRSATGRKWTCGSISIGRRSRCPRLYFTHQRECVDRDGVLLAQSEYLTLKPGETPRPVSGALPHHRRHDVHRRDPLPGHARWRRSSRRWPPAASRSAATAPTTSARKRRWKTAKKKGISDGLARSERRRTDDIFRRVFSAAIWIWSCCASRRRAAWTTAKAR